MFRLQLAYYFQQHGCSPLLVAGDTFRSGAVEQLKVHADCLNIPLFSQGYSKDPSAVTKAAIQLGQNFGMLDDRDADQGSGLAALNDGPFDWPLSNFARR